MILRYVGPKRLPMVLNTPIPFVSRSYAEGQIQFTPEAEVRDDWAAFLLTECAGAFERVGAPYVSTDQAPRPTKPKQDPTIYVGKRFTGKAAKWKAAAFIKKHHAEDILGMRKLQIIDRVIHWELVEIALADVTCEMLKNTWNTKASKLAKSEQREPDSIPVATAGVLAPSIP